jgi:hypothetical protein
MTEDEELIQRLFDGLVKHLIVLSLPADYQREYMGLGHTGDELALEFENYYTLHKEQYINQGLINKEQKSQLDYLDNFFDERSGKDHIEFWEEVKSHSDWELVRDAAKECIAALDKQEYGIKVKYDYEKNYFDGQEHWVMHSTKTELIKKAAANIA